MSQNVVDLRSDTVTLPTEEMREAMYRAEVGDSMRGEDPSVNELQALAAEMLGKEAALYVPSGTMGNLIGILAHTTHGDEILFEAETHPYYYEVGGFAALGGLSARPILGTYGVMDPQAIEEAIRPASTFFPRASLLVLENTHNRGGGNAIPVEVLGGMAAVARQHGLAVHLDGARIFNAAAALDVPAREIAAVADSVQFCLSKGLSAPVGSILTASREIIKKAAKFRKLVGGDMRQAGIVAAAGVVALRSMVGRLAEDHHRAAMLADALSLIPNVTIERPTIPTNMVFIDTTALGMTSAELAQQLATEVLAVPYGRNRLRMVTHRHITNDDIEHTAEAVRTLVEARTL